jgi:hypothetical protein
MLKITCGALVLVAVLLLPAPPAHADAVVVSGRQILINGSPFQARGVCYAPTPIGGEADLSPYGDYFTASYQTIYNRDLPRMRQMGANCLRVYGWAPAADHTAFLDAAYNGGQRPIHVLLNVWVDPSTDWSDTNAVNDIISTWVTLATNVMSHPAVLGYLIGNELNSYGSNAQNPLFWAALNNIAGAIRQWDTNHLISTTLADGNLSATIASADSTMTNFNAWCVQVYRGNTFGTLFTDYAAASAKPLLVTEFGMDAYDERISAEYVNNAAVQADFVASLCNELSSNAPVASGGCVFEWTDEWWKYTNPSAHDPGGWANAAFPDGWADEEWWGINRISSGGSGAPDILQPRAVFDHLRTLWTAWLSITQTAPAQIQVIVQGATGQTAVCLTSTNLQSWTATATNSVPFTNTLSIGVSSPPGFFRVELR